MAAICTAQPIQRRRREPALVRSVMALALNGMRKLARALKNRRQAVMLARMDDRMLADIGLNRSDLRDPISGPNALDGLGYVTPPLISETNVYNLSHHNR